MILTGSQARTITFENGEQVYPCRCQETHRGDYAVYDYAHHNCFHEDELSGFWLEKDTIQAICPLCGMSWIVRMEDERDT